MPTSPVRSLSPGYFALVMATGIIAVGCDQHGLDIGARVLFAITVAAFVVLSVLLMLRTVRYPRLVLSDTTHHAKGFAFLTTVAGTNVLGAASAYLFGWWGMAWAMWWLSLPLWAVWLYTALIASVLRKDKPDLRHGINGTWFMLTVSTESIVVLAALLFGRTDDDLLAFTAVGLFLLGVVLYIIVMTMVFLRWTFRTLDPSELDPPGWIAAGAVAITALAGAELQAVAPESERLIRLMPVIEGVTMMAWATATFWFPLMIAIWVWRYIIERVPLTYQPAFWSLVFPLGMYSVASDQMFDVLEVGRLGWLPPTALTIAIVAWSATFIGMLHHLIRRPSGDEGSAL